MDPKDIKSFENILIDILGNQVKKNIPETNSPEFIIGSIRPNGNYSFSENPVVHKCPTKAQTEAERLAVSNPGKQFVVVQRVSTVRTAPPKPVWGV